jgi:hypothetical protein
MSRRRQHPTTERELGEAVHHALLHRGWLPPATSEAVAAAERGLSEGEDAAPARALPSFAEVAAGPARDSGRWQILPQGLGPVEETLARAAREGGPLPPAVELAMRRDRDAAEARAKAAAAEKRDHGD